MAGSSHPAFNTSTELKKEQMDLSEVVEKFGYCPHFNKEMQACNLHSDGIYLPSRAYLVFYCLNDEFSRCATFKRHDLMGKYRMSQFAEGAAGRRRQCRIPEQWHILIRPGNPPGIVKGDIPATVIDFSQSGMRLVIKADIPTDGQLHFVFGNEFFIPGFQGTALPCWHRKLQGTQNGVEAGFLFDERSRIVLAAHIGE